MWLHEAVRDLWACPQCGRRFANRNQSHSCGDQRLDETLDRHSEIIVGLYHSIEAAIGAGGQFRVHPQKTRIAFISRMSFASVVLARRWVDLSFILPNPVGDPRIRRIDLYGPTSFGHATRLRSVDDVDSTVRAWLIEAHRRGDQETLDPHAEVAPVVGHALEILTVPLAAQVVHRGDDLVLAVPRYAAQALEASPELDVRIGGEQHDAHFVAHSDVHLVAFEDDVLIELGLAEGDGVDITLRPLL